MTNTEPKKVFQLGQSLAITLPRKDVKTKKIKSGDYVKVNFDKVKITTITENLKQKKLT